MFAWCSMFTCISVCGMILLHRFSGNKSSTPHKTDLKCPLNVCIPLLAKFMWCITDVTNSYCISFLFIFLCRHLIFYYRGYVSLSWFRIYSVSWLRSDMCLSFNFLFYFSLTLLKFNWYLNYTLSLGICDPFLRRLGTYPFGWCILCSSFSLTSHIYHNAFGGVIWLLLHLLQIGRPVYCLFLSYYLSCLLHVSCFGFPMLLGNTCLWLW